MTREEQIDRAINTYAWICTHFGAYSEDIKQVFAQIFRDGIEWADENPKNVWHDLSEYPTENGAILYQTTLGQFRTICDGKCGEGAWKVFTIDQDVARWAYIKDLLPKEGEK